MNQFDIEVTDDEQTLLFIDLEQGPDAPPAAELVMNDQDLRDLEDFLLEERLRRKGHQRINVAAGDVQPNDIIPSLGLVVKDILTEVDEGKVCLQNDYFDVEVLVPKTLELTIHRAIP